MYRNYSTRARRFRYIRERFVLLKKQMVVELHCFKLLFNSKGKKKSDA
jgi:hypothetical protein